MNGWIGALTTGGLDSFHGTAIDEVNFRQVGGKTLFCSEGWRTLPLETSRPLHFVAGRGFFAYSNLKGELGVRAKGREVLANGGAFHLGEWEPRYSHDSCLENDDIGVGWNDHEHGVREAGTPRE